MPIFPSSNGRFSFAPLVGNGTIGVEDVDIVAGTGVATVAGGGVGTMVADKDGVVVVVRIMGDVAGAEVTAGSVMPGETTGVVTTGVVVEITAGSATDSDVVVTTDSDVVVEITAGSATDSDVVITTDSDVVVTTDSDVVVTTDSDVVVTTDSDVDVEGIGGKVRGSIGGVHTESKSQVPDDGECQFPRNEITQQCLPISSGVNGGSKFGSMGITQSPHPWIASRLSVVQRQERSLHELYSAAAAVQSSVH
jgi:hypothetical protein